LGIRKGNEREDRGQKGRKGKDKMVIKGKTGGEGKERGRKGINLPHGCLKTLAALDSA